jgi:hypothetical protein
MSRSARTVLVLAVVGAAAVLSAGLRVASARAADPQQPSDLAAAISDYADSQVEAATAQADAIVAQASQAQVPAPAVPTAAGVPAPPSEPAVPPPPAVVPQPPVAAGPVEIPAIANGQPVSPAIVLPVMPSGTLGLPDAGRTVGHDLEGMTSRQKRTVRAKTTVVGHARILRLDVQSSTSASWSSSSSSARSVARSSVRSSVESSTTGSGRSQRPAPPKVPLPFPPLPPNAPAPNSGATPTGGSGGQGALLIFFVAVAVLVLFGVHRLLRKVHWSNLRMPRRGAALPWRPG